MYTFIAILSAFIFIYSLSSRILDKTVLTGAMVFTVFGVLFGPDVLNILDRKRVV